MRKQNERVAIMNEYNPGSSLLRDELVAERLRIRGVWGKNARLPASEVTTVSTKVLLPLPQLPMVPAVNVDPFVGSPLNPNMTFASYLVSDSNRLAYCETTRAATTPSKFYNPLYLHSQVGFGKTHLLQAFAHAATSRARRVLYLTAERFLSAMRGHKDAYYFIESVWPTTDVLVIDDIQFLQGKTIRHDISSIIDAFIDPRRQIVIAADRPPSELEGLEDRVLSRLGGGLCIEIGKPELDLRVKILETLIAAHKVDHHGLEIPAEVIAYVASVIQTNGRDLHGAVNRLIAYAPLNGGPYSISTAEYAVRDLIRVEKKKVRIEDIQKLVAHHFNVSRGDILSARRTANVVRPRMIAMYLAKQLTPRSLPDIGRRFGDKDHTTVLHAVRKITARVAEDKVLAETIDVLSRMLTT